MQDVEIIGLLKTYVKQTLAGMGALKGAACQITSIVDSGTSHVITFSWEDNSGVTHTDTLTLVDGADEVDELKDISITNLQDGQVLAWDNTAKKWVNTANSSTVESINNIGDVTVTNVTNGQVLEWDDTASKWVNASLGTAAKKDSTNAVTENSTDVVESGAVFTAIDDAVKALDVSDTAVAGSYVTEVSETDGKISVTREAADAAPTENSNKLVKSGGVHSAIDDAVKALDVSDTAVAGSYVTEVSETDGKISVVREAADAAPTENSNKLVKSGGVYSAIDDAVKTLDVSDTAVAGSYVTEVSETDGKISVTREAADAAPTENSNKLVKSGGVYSAIDDAVKALDVTDSPVTGSYVTAVSETDGKINVTRVEADSEPTKNSPKAVKSNGVYVADNTIYSVMGINGAKNLVDIPDFTLIKDTDRTKSVSVRALPKRPYICSFDVTDASVPIDGQVQVFDINNYAVGGVTIRENGHYSFPVSADHDDYRNIYAYINSTLADGTTMKISNFMVRLASDTDDTYEPYAKTNRQLTEVTEGKAEQTEVNDIVNTLGAKNLLAQTKMQVRLASDSVGYWATSVNGLTITYGDDGSIDINGTPSDSSKTSVIRFEWEQLSHDYNIEHLAGQKVIGSISDTAISGITLRLGYFDKNGEESQSDPISTKAEYTYPSTAAWGRTFLAINGGYSYNHAKVYPMIRLASITDDTYEPYAKTNQQLTQETNALDPILNKLGAKNLLPYPFKDTTQTVNGVTFTDNGDGSISVNGTATAEAVFLLTDWNYDYANAIPLLARYILNGNPSGSNFATYLIQIIYVNSSNEKKWITSNADETIVENKGDGYDRVGFRIVVKSGTTVNNVLFKPMLRYASIADGTYVPYAMTNQQMTPYVQAISNPNLLDNPWFTVNQRGLSTYSNVNYSYTVDRWLGSSGFDLYVDSDGVSVSSGNKSIFERFEDSLYNFLVGKTVTLSVLKSNGSIVSKSGVVKSNGNSFGYESDSDVSLYLTKDQYANFVQVVFKNTTVKVRAVKLELGTVSTLAQDTAPNYQQELAKCQRYYQVFRATNENDWIALGFASTATSFEVVLPLIVPMRVKPTITMTDCYVTNASQQDVSLSTTNLVQSDANNSKIHLNITPTANLTDVLGPYAFKLIANSGKLALSADL